MPLLSNFRLSVENKATIEFMFAGIMICFGPGSDSEPFSDLSRLGWRGGGEGEGEGEGTKMTS